MKTKTSLSLSEELVTRLDRLAGPRVSRSAFIEKILSDFVESQARAKRSARDTAALNRHASELNAEMADALSNQAPMDEA